MSKKALIKAFRVEVIEALQPESNNDFFKEDPDNYFPPLHSIHQTVKFPDEKKYYRSQQEKSGPTWLFR